MNTIDDNPLRDIASSQYGLIDKVTFFCGKVRTYNDVYQRLYDIDLSEAYKGSAGTLQNAGCPKF